jgi:4-amino-4-deoxy-L-arabinose transferase-like glycosyltransferase
MAQVSRLRPGVALWWLAAALLAGALLRVGWLAAIDTQPVTDFDWYFTRATEISRGMGYQVEESPTAYWPAGYPALLGAWLALLGSSVTAAKALNILLSMTAIPLVFWIAERLLRSERAAIAAGWMAALFPPFVAYSNILASEPLYVALTLIGVLWMLQAGPRRRWWLGAGLAFGVAALVRPQAAVLPFLVLLAVWLGDGEALEGLSPWAAAGLVLAGTVLPLVPWTIRNAQVFNSFVFVSTNGGDNLLIGHHDGATGRYKNPDACGLERPPGMGEVERDREARAAALAYIRSEPQSVLNLAGAKLAATFGPGRDAAYWGFQTERGRLIVPGRFEDQYLFKWFSGAAWWGQALLLAGALAGTGWLALRLRRVPITPLVVLGFTALVSVAFFGNPRFGLPAVPFLVVLACGFLASPVTSRTEASK